LYTFMSTRELHACTHASSTCSQQDVPAGAGKQVCIVFSCIHVHIVFSCIHVHCMCVQSTVSPTSTPNTYRHTYTQQDVSVGAGKQVCAHCCTFKFRFCSSAGWSHGTGCADLVCHAFTHTAAPYADAASLTNSA
jgi:hypothetical protein